MQNHVVSGLHMRAVVHRLAVSALVLFFSYPAIYPAASSHFHPELPVEAKAALDAQAESMQEMLCTWHENSDSIQRCVTHKCLPGYFLKYGVERVTNAQRLRAIIKEHELDIIVPDKYLYHVPSRPRRVANDNYIVVVKEVDGVLGKRYSLKREQMRQLCILVLFAKYYDLHSENYIITPEGKLAIIDTDEQAMPDSRTVALLEADWLKHGPDLYNAEGLLDAPMMFNDPLGYLGFGLSNGTLKCDSDAYFYLYEELKKRAAHRQKLLLSQGSAL